MPKLKNLSADDFAKLFNDSEDLIQRIWEAAEMIEKGYVDRLPEVAAHARSSAAFATAVTTLTSRLLTKAEMQRMDDEIESLRSRTA